MPSTDSWSRRSLATLGLVVLLVLAGCGGVSDPQATSSPTPSTDPTTNRLVSSTTPTSATPTSATPTPASTPTPTPVSTPASTATPAPTTTASERLVAGVSTDGVENVTAVIDAHRAQLVATPGVVEHRTNATYGYVSVVASTRVTATANLSRVRYVSKAVRRTENDTRTLLEVITANETTVGQYAARDGTVTLDDQRNRTELYDGALRSLSTAVNPLRGTLDRGHFTVSDVASVDGTKLVTLTADDYTGGQLFDPSNVTEYTATVRIAADGSIRSATEHIVAVVGDDERHYDYTYRFTPGTVDLPATPRVPDDLRVASDGDENTTEQRSARHPPRV